MVQQRNGTPGPTPELPGHAIVTGGAGFIGSHTVDRLLADGWTVTVIDNYSTGRPENLAHHVGNRNLTVIHADINDRKRLTQVFEDVDWVIHLAAVADIVPSIEHPSEYFRSNVDGTLSVLEMARAGKVKRVIYAASSSCYGIPTEYPTTEAALVQPQYPYALTKWMGEETVLHWGQVYHLPVVSLRFFNVYGPRSRTSGSYGAVFGVFLAQKLKNQPFTVVGDGHQTRDFTYVTDIVDAIVTAARSNVTQKIYNVGSGGHSSVNRLVELLGGPVTHIPKRPGEPDCTWADISKIQKDLNWSPRVSLEDGVAQLLNQIDYWRDAPVWTPETIQKATQTWFKLLK